MTRREQMATMQTVLVLLATGALDEDVRRLGQPEGWAPPGMDKQPWKRRHKSRASNGPGGPKVRLRIPGGRP